MPPTPLAPEIVAPLGAASTQIRIRAAIVGATLEVTASGSGGFTQSFAVTFPDAVYTLTSRLAASQTVTAKQTYKGSLSASSWPVVVQSAPTALSALSVATTMNQCGRALWARGAAPGAEVTLISGTMVLGSAQAVGDWAKIGDYDPPATMAGLSLQLQQTCNGVTSSQSTAPAVAHIDNIPTPKLRLPLVACQTSLTVSGVLGGAYVEIKRSTAPTKQVLVAFGLDEEVIWLDRELKASEQIQVRQGFKCKKESPDLEAHSDWVGGTVDPATKAPKPTFQSRPCPMSTHVTLGNLIPGARVVLKVNSKELETDAPDTHYTFATPAISGTIEAYQSLCDKPSDPAKIDVAKAAYAPASIAVCTLYPCAAYIYVVLYGDGSVEPPPADQNYLFYVTNSSQQQISVYQHELDKFGGALIPVNPGLVAGESITVHVQGCGGAFQSYGPYTVQPGPPPMPAFLTPVPGGRAEIAINSGTAGATLDVYVQGAWHGSAISLGNLQTTFVPLDITLQTGMTVSCTQTMCGVPGDPTPPTPVGKQAPLAPTLVAPPNGDQSVAMPVRLAWSDPGAGTGASADYYALQVTQGTTLVVNVPDLTAESFQASLVVGTAYTWTVEAVNSGGYNHGDLWSFKTQSTPQAVLSLVAPVVVPRGDNPFPRGTQFTVGIEVQNTGTAASTAGAYSVSFSGSLDQVPYTSFGAVDVSVPVIGMGASTIVSTPLTLPEDARTMRITATLTAGGNTVGTPVWLAG